MIHMTTINSSSAAESTMDDVSNFQSLSKRHRSSATTAAGDGNSKAVEAEEGDNEVWQTFNKSFREVQSVLDRNRALIQQVNENHKSKIPDNMVKNVALIQEINSNISKVQSLYTDFSSNFSNIFHQRSKNNTGKESSSEEL